MIDRMRNLRRAAGWSWRSKFYNNTFNTARIAQPGYHLFNARLGWSSAGEKFGLAATVKNIGNERFLLSRILVDVIQAFAGVYNHGRECSFTASVRF
ncbi:MAG: hypothetical protein RL268_1980 [Pseudomonadota bacterium]|jgi:iron complex outermembrane receptor protein